MFQKFARWFLGGSLLLTVAAPGEPLANPAGSNDPEQTILLGLVPFIEPTIIYSAVSGQCRTKVIAPGYNNNIPFPLAPQNLKILVTNQTPIDTTVFAACEFFNNRSGTPLRSALRKGETVSHICTATDSRGTPLVPPVAALSGMVWIGDNISCPPATITAEYHALTNTMSVVVKDLLAAMPLPAVIEEASEPEETVPLGLVPFIDPTIIYSPVSGTCRTKVIAPGFTNNLGFPLAPQNLKIRVTNQTQIDTTVLATCEFMNNRSGTPLRSTLRKGETVSYTCTATDTRGTPLVPPVAALSGMVWIGDNISCPPATISAEYDTVTNTMSVVVKDSLW